MTESPSFVGIDVSKAALDVAVRPGGLAFRVANDPAGHAELVGRLRPLAPTLIVLEATGGYETPAAAALQAAGLPAVAVNPARPATSPGGPAGWPRPTASTPRPWPTSPRSCAPSPGPCHRPGNRPWTPC
jgi:hypothetical protein